MGIHACTIGVAIGRKLVDNVLQLYPVITPTGEQCQIEHGSESHIVVILVIHGVTQIVATVVRLVIYTKEVIDHVGVSTCLVGVVERTHQSYLRTIQIPAVAPVSPQLQIAERLTLLHTPIVVETVALQVDRTGRIQGLQSRIEPTAKRTETTVESQEIRTTSLGIAEILECGCVIPVAANGDSPTVLRRNIFRIDLDESTAEIRRIFGAGRFHDHQVVDLAAGDDVKREGA